MDFPTTFGAHSVCLASPDILHCVFGGRFTEEEAHTMVQTIQQAGARFGPLFACVDVRDFRTSGPKVRAIMANAGGRAYPFRAAVVFGASFSIRTAMNLVIRAARLFRADVFAFPIEFVATKDEALAWLAAQRGLSARSL